VGTNIVYIDSGMVFVRWTSKKKKKERIERRSDGVGMINGKQTYIFQFLHRFKLPISPFFIILFGFPHIASLK